MGNMSNVVRTQNNLISTISLLLDKEKPSR